ncbi:MarR family transcriptional regulator [Microbacterium sp. X-17]|uniref:MarR family winged helix-turn-helix transcriptional regulator n=1 Tax=Microbacterium sp. X-17 TaxID=3144404 RepID=UPI0031F4D0AC
MAQDRTVTSATRLALAVGRINRQLRAFGEGLSYGQLSALSTIIHLGPLRPSEIARVEMIAAPTSTRLVAELESRGLVMRESDPADGRSWLVSGTPAGEDMLLHAREERTMRMQALLDSLDEQQRAVLDAAIDALEVLAAATPSR